jgi:hypothetical protein
MATVITGTILATGKTFTHGLGTTPDICVAQLEEDTSGTNARGAFVSTFGTQTVTVGGPVDGAAVRVLCKRIHSIEDVTR